MSEAAVTICMAGAGIACMGTAAVAFPPTRRLADRVRPYTVATRARFGSGSDRSDLVWPTTTGSSLVRTFAPLTLAVLRRLGRALERRTDASLERSLRQAGLTDVTADAYRTRTALHVFGLGLAGALTGAVVFHDAIAAVALACCGVVLGASRLRGRLERETASRCETIRLELATVNQLLAIHVRTGAGPIQATQRIVDRGHGVVVDELRGVLEAVRAGIPEGDAFRSAAALIPEPAAARTYKLFAAGAERGVDLADGLRALSEDLRDARREEIRQSATKRRAAMLVPTIAVLAPVMLLFIAAPLPSIVFGGR